MQKNKKSNFKKTNKNNLNNSSAHFQWVGGLVCLILLVSAALLPQKAHAADRSWGNIDLAKKVIENVSPVVSEVKPETATASLVFASDEFIQKPLVVETKVTKEEPKPRPVVKQTVRVAAVSTLSSGTSHRFPYGYCTYYVSQRRSIPWSGNAITWLSGARAYGYATGDEPKVGAIVVTSEGGYTGHVGMVDAVNEDGTILITEMNYNGWGVISSRTVPTTYSRILGYIY